MLPLSTLEKNTILRKNTPKPNFIRILKLYGIATIFPKTALTKTIKTTLIKVVFSRYSSTIFFNGLSAGPSMTSPVIENLDP
jgi:hypothetical protein